MNAFDQAIQGSSPVLVDFFAIWCAPCKTQAPILKDLASKIGNSARILKVDVDKNQQVASKYGIRSVPTLVLFKQGKIVWKGTGVHQTNQLISIINQNQ
jgi:thioredoxin 1